MAQSHLVLARKYRPVHFADLMGQEVIVQIIQNAMRLDKLGHAFLFHGVRGVGKTTTARLMARAINCTAESARIDYEPCNACENCVAILEDRHIDVIEMDAASHTGVDDIRPLIEAARYHPQKARFKVYIIDEVHMLSKSAFNALLKTLEEPPAHLKFIFATTEIKRIPATILSRCLRFDLKRLGLETLTQHFAHILKLEACGAEEEALRLISCAADGSVRDGLSLLDQFIAGCGNFITTDYVRQSLGLTKTQDIIQLFEKIISGQAQVTLSLWQHMYQQGNEVQWVLNELLALTHDLIQKKLQIPLQNPEYDIPDLSKWSSLLSQELLLRFWQILIRGLEELKIAPQPVQFMDVLLIKLMLVDPKKTFEPQALDEEMTPPTTLNFSSPIQYTPKVHLPDHTQMVSVSTVDENPPTTFEELLKLVEHHKSPLLHHHLMHDVEMIEYRPGYIHMALRANAPKNLGLHITKELQDWTGFVWQIQISKERGQPTLKEKQYAIEDEIFQQGLQTPIAQKLKQTFPDASFSLIPKNEIIY